MTTQPSPIQAAELLPCPFCGSSKILKGERYFAICVDCGATGPERSGDKGGVKIAFKDWNSRTHAEAIQVPPDEAAVRREFEAWAKTQGLPTPKLKGETYMSHAARWAWQAYLAAARTQD